ncbi:hypothetical protein O9929_24865 [Vibrio lentus]|nr:hypothetical protein [Vibrio lentus]
MRVTTHKIAIGKLVGLMEDLGFTVADIVAIGHRIVHGGEKIHSDCSYYRRSNE